ncbi:hypothetical protein EVAR_41521_1 [Eumeta japonica]|uniref:RNase H type-1 domain-containing protein n=1 Tax=Eumeta variegata TaxID=151549 RepID=A0A4C1X2D7_EUMVA|nr:hypothetical protein EVAR_41521_1 [Eumeta japonica]
MLRTLGHLRQTSMACEKMLDAVALKTCRAHSTVSSHSTRIHSGLLSLDFTVKEVAWLYGVKRVTPKSSLVVWTSSKTCYPLAYVARRDISEIVAEGRAVRLFCVRAHAGITRNEHAASSPGGRRAVLTKMTTADSAVAREKGLGHGIHPHCGCYPAKIQDVLHVLEDRDMFLRERVAVNAETDLRVTRQHFPELMEDIGENSSIQVLDEYLGYTRDKPSV